jgi:D-alanyl-D-alanine carboxypeptidase/D-alanyl-D-alanine-endopeptidase (penicillin-binding protein 4)
MIFRYLVLLTLVLRLGAASLSDRIEQAIAASPAARSAFWGIQVVDIGSGKVLYQRNPNSFFVPASNTKLFTTALALTRLGPEFTYRTSVTADKAPDANGSIHGDLILVGGGDPNLSSRPIPYRTGPTEGDPLVAIEDLAAQVAARGVTRIDGDVVGDDRWYTWDPYAGGWSVDDPLYGYGTAVSALCVNDNSQSLQVLPGAREGDLAGIELSPALEYYRIDNRVVTVGADGERRLHYDRMPGSLDLRVWGTVPLGKPRPPLLLGIDDPAAFAAFALRDALERRGITVTGSAVARHRFPNDDAAPASSSVEIASHVSAPLLEDLRITDKVSQNLHAEMTLRAVGKAKRNEGAREAGLE